MTTGFCLSHRCSYFLDNSSSFCVLENVLTPYTNQLYSPPPITIEADSGLILLDLLNCYTVTSTYVTVLYLKTFMSVACLCVWICIMPIARCLGTNACLHLNICIWCIYAYTVNRYTSDQVLIRILCVLSCILLAWLRSVQVCVSVAIVSWSPAVLQ